MYTLRKKSMQVALNGERTKVKRLASEQPSKLLWRHVTWFIMYIRLYITDCIILFERALRAWQFNYDDFVRKTKRPEILPNLYVTNYLDIIPRKEIKEASWICRHLHINLHTFEQATAARIQVYSCCKNTALPRWKRNRRKLHSRKVYTQWVDNTKQPH